MHIYFVNNTLTLEISKFLAKNHINETHVLVIVNSRLSHTTIDWPGLVIDCSPKPSKGKLSFFLNDFKRSRALYNKIKELLNNVLPGARVSIYLPNIHHSLTNPVFYSIPHEFSGLFFDFNILVEGTLNFTAHKISINYFTIMLFKLALAKINGLPYKIFFGSFCGDDRTNISKIYSPTLSGLGHSAAKVVKVDFKFNSAPSPQETDSILILGQYLDEQLGAKKGQHLSKCLIEWIFSNIRESSKLYYKGHPLHADKTLESILKNHDVTFLDSNIPLETLIVTGNFSKIISFSSSGLMMAKLIMGSHIECIAYGLEYLNKNTKFDYMKIKSAFLDIGVKCVEMSE